MMLLELILLSVCIAGAVNTTIISIRDIKDKRELAQLNHKLKMANINCALAMNDLKLACSKADEKCK